MEGNQVVKLIVTRCPLFRVLLSCAKISVGFCGLSVPTPETRGIKVFVSFGWRCHFSFNFFKEIYAAQTCMFVPLSAWRLRQFWLWACLWAELWALIEHDSVLEADFCFWSKSWTESVYAKGQDKSVHSAHQQLRFEIIFLISSISVISNF